jgi:hypothetical protein
MSSKRPPPKPSRPPGAKQPSRPPAQKSLRTITKQGPFELPPIPKSPRPKFHSEPPTRQKNVTASVYQSLISVFDAMTPAQQMEFVDATAMYSKLDAGGRRALVELLATYPELTAADRVAVHELAEHLAVAGEKTNKK